MGTGVLSEPRHRGQNKSEANSTADASQAESRSAQLARWPGPGALSTKATDVHGRLPPTPSPRPPNLIHLPFAQRGRHDIPTQRLVLRLPGFRHVQPGTRVRWWCSWALGAKAGNLNLYFFFFLSLLYIFFLSDIFSRRITLTAVSKKTPGFLN